MNKYRNTNASNSTKTYNKLEIEDQTNNIYEAISIIAKRSTQINSEIKKELHDKLEEFATHNDSLEEVFENKEQIEVSKFYVLSLLDVTKAESCQSLLDWVGSLGLPGNSTSFRLGFDIVGEFKGACRVCLLSR
jgi:DNA-directed RNA polymerase subunit K/omega